MKAILTIAVLVGLGAADAYAQNEAFNSLVQDGMNHYRARRYDRAIEKFEAAYGLSPQPELIYNVARAYEKSLKREEAIAAYERFLKLEGTTADLRAKALSALTALRRETAAMEASEAAKNAPRPAVAPTGPGAVTRPPAPEQRSRTLEWVLIGGGAAVAATGAVFGVLALQANSDFDDLKANNADRTALEDQKSTVEGRALAADVLVGVGAVSAVAGVILLLTRSDDDGSVAVAPMVGTDFAAMSVSGRF